MSDAIREMYQRWQDGYAFCEDSDYDVELAERVDAELASPDSPPAEALQESTAEKLLRRFIHHERGIMADLRTAHSNRGPGASSFMREDDRDQYEALEKLFGEARTALTLAAEDR